MSFGFRCRQAIIALSDGIFHCCPSQPKKKSAGLGGGGAVKYATEGIICIVSTGYRSDSESGFECWRKGK
ncbi:hypothetical protein AVEN_140457-1 [Araneus ventricosus]|uniref:Uncharacterized protein n=1 Tax=Araneus ventricosus TaxID=182803 RepID=A0A4Y2AV99_ARAVE|nr:hypothetical protein AVEN_140457-1 [Araneus ventricosus]